MFTAMRWSLGAMAAAAYLASSTASAQQTIPRAGQAAQAGQRAIQQQQQVPQAQPGQQAQPRTTLRAVQGRPGETNADHQIATWLVLCNDMESQLAQFGQKHAHTNQVKQFAEKLADQHATLNNQLRQFAPDAPMLSAREPQNAPARDDREGTARQAQVPPAGQPVQRQTGQTTHAPVAGQQQTGLPMMQVALQIAERNLPWIEKELQRKQGSEFDQAFIELQVYEHGALLNTLHVLRQYASADLQNTIDAAIRHSEQHLTDARAICGQLAGRDGAEKGTEARTSRQDRDDKDSKDTQRENK